jgi:hypothetical protein
MRSLFLCFAFLLFLLHHHSACAFEKLISLCGEEPGGRFGTSLSSGDINGDGYSDVIVGASGDFINSLCIGKVYVFFGGKEMDAVPDLIIEGQAPGDCFGVSLDGSGDVNGDGCCDVIAGAFGADGRTGKVYMFLGGSSIDSIPDLVIAGENTGDSFGYSLCYAGDMNGDGCDEIAIGAPGNDGNGMKGGKAYVLLGGDPMDAIADLVLSAEGEYDYFGSTVSGAGDVNGDGCDDLVVGAPTWSDPLFISGAYPNGCAYIFFGDIIPDYIHDAKLIGDISWSWLFGSGIFGGGDFNADGYDDILVFNQDFYSPSIIFVTFGDPDISSAKRNTLTGEFPYDCFGGTSCFTDLDGDGCSDIVVGAKRNELSGKIYVFSGGPGADVQPDLKVSGEASFDWFGSSVCRATDIDGDGMEDLVVGAPGNDDCAEEAGKVYIYRGGTLSSTSNMTMKKHEPRQCMIPDCPGPEISKTLGSGNALGRITSREEGGNKTNPVVVRKVISQISQSEIIDKIENLQNFQTRHTFTSQCLHAADYIYESFSSWGIDTDYNYYNFFGDRFSNVVGCIPGRSRSKETYIVCGHYDSISEDDPYVHAPGAEDNASGTAAVLEIARIFSRYPFASSIRFVCLSGEEVGLLGSMHYAFEIAEEEIDVRAVINLDQISYTIGGEMNIELATRSDWLTEQFVTVTEAYTELSCIRIAEARADAHPFEYLGFDAVLCAGASRGEYPYYHTSQDLLDKLDTGFTTEVTRATTAVLIELMGILPLPPPSPILEAAPGDHSVTLTWDDSSESAPNPYTEIADFEGYRIYRSNEKNLENAAMLVQFDRSNGIGPDSGLQHTYTDENLLNGYRYWYAVTAYNNGMDSGLGEAESSFFENAVSACPVSTASLDLEDIRVVPNPCRRGRDNWSGWGEKIQFTNLPSKATVKIFTMSGDLVKTIYHANSNSGTADWYPESLAGGVYLFVVDSPRGRKTGKFVILN